MYHSIFVPESTLLILSVLVIFQNLSKNNVFDPLVFDSKYLKLRSLDISACKFSLNLKAK